MRKMKILKSLMWFGVLSAGFAQAGYSASNHLKYKVEYPKSKSTSTAEITLNDMGVRMDSGESRDAGPYSVIVSLEKEVVWVVNHTDKSYLEFDKGGPVAKFNQNKAKIAERWESAYEKLDPSKRISFNKMMPGFKPKSDFRWVNGKDKDKVISGFKCKVVRKFDKDKLLREYCFSTEKAFDEVRARIKKSQTVWKAIYPLQENYYMEMHVKGVPVEVKTYGANGKVTKVETLESFEPKKVHKKSPIAVPSGYYAKSRNKKPAQKTK